MYLAQRPLFLYLRKFSSPMQHSLDRHLSEGLDFASENRPFCSLERCITASVLGTLLFLVFATDDPNTKFVVCKSQCQLDNICQVGCESLEDHCGAIFGS